MDDRKIYDSQKIQKRAEDSAAGQSGGRDNAAHLKGGDESGRSYVQMLYNDLCRFADVIVENAASQRLGVHAKPQAKRHVPKPQKIPPPHNDETGRVYNEMRKLAGPSGGAIGLSDILYNRPVNAQVFYRQAVFMRDFSDDYGFTTPYEPFSPSFICYQRMNREQLRTFFSWRSEVRKGSVRRVPCGYALLYIYELLNLDCAENAHEGLDKILSFRNKFWELDDQLEKHLPALLLDYYVYYLPDTPLHEFLAECCLGEYFAGRYKQNRDEELLMILYRASKYNVRESAFYKSEGCAALMDECMLFVVNYLESCFKSGNSSFLDSIYRLSRTNWTPFSAIPFYQRNRQVDRTVDFTPNESYFCKNGSWFHKSVYVMDSGKKLAGYAVKCTESALRRAVKYKRKITVNPDMLDYTVTRKLTKLGISLESEIDSAVSNFIALKNKTVVTVNAESLSRIRHEASEIQEKLTVSDAAAEEFYKPAAAPVLQEEHQTNGDIWLQFSQSLSDTESGALRAVLSGGDFKCAADAVGVMAEVLADSINEKAYDALGDSIMDFDGCAVIYDEYREKLTEVLS